MLTYSSMEIVPSPLTSTFSNNSESAEGETSQMFPFKISMKSKMTVKHQTFMVSSVANILCNDRNLEDK